MYFFCYVLFCIISNVTNLNICYVISEKKKELTLFQQQVCGADSVEVPTLETNSKILQWQKNSSLEKGCLQSERKILFCKFVPWDHLAL